MGKRKDVPYSIDIRFIVLDSVLAGEKRTKRKMLNVMTVREIGMNHFLRVVVEYQCFSTMENRRLWRAAMYDG